VVVIRGVDEHAAVVGVKPTPGVPSDAYDRRHRSSGETPLTFTAVSVPVALVAECSIAGRVAGPAPAVFIVPRELEIVALGPTLSG
jgi:hypothetical protein